MYFNRCGLPGRYSSGLKLVEVFWGQWLLFLHSKDCSIFEMERSLSPGDHGLPCQFLKGAVHSVARDLPSCGSQLLSGPWIFSEGHGDKGEPTGGLAEQKCAQKHGGPAPCPLPEMCFLLTPGLWSVSSVPALFFQPGSHLLTLLSPRAMCTIFYLINVVTLNSESI